MSNGREVGNWLRAYMEYTMESESPEQFHLWTGLSVLASAVRRRVYLNMGLFMLYPNMYVILVGPPGRVAKSTSIRLGRNILTGVQDIKFGPDSVTREELIRQMAKVGDKTNEAAMTIHSTELSSLIEPSGVAMIQFLTDIYDGDFKWRYSTKGSGRDTINAPLLNILGGTTPSWIAEGLPADVIGHGFTSRVVFVYGERPRSLNPFPNEPPKRLVEGLQEDLNNIALLKGPFNFTDGARDLYAKHYKELDSSIPDDYRIEGFHWRKRTHLLKLSMLFSISERDSKDILTEDVDAAWTLLQSTEKLMARTFSAVGKNPLAQDTERLIAEINEKGAMTIEEVFERYYAVGDQKTIAGLIAMALSMGRIDRKKDPKTGEIIYTSKT